MEGPNLLEETGGANPRGYYMWSRGRSELLRAQQQGATVTSGAVCRLDRGSVTEATWWVTEDAGNHKSSSKPRVGCELLGVKILSSKSDTISQPYLTPPHDSSSERVSRTDPVTGLLSRTGGQPWPGPQDDFAGMSSAVLWGIVSG